MAKTGSAPARKKAPGRGGRRRGQGAKPLTADQRLSRSISLEGAKSELISENARALLEVTDTSPRRKLLAHLSDPEGIADPRLEAGWVASDGPWLAATVSRLCVQTIGRWKGLPLVFEGWQVRFVTDALSFEDGSTVGVSGLEVGEYLYGTALLGIPRKNGKTVTTAAAAVVKASPCDGEGRPEVLLAAGSREQTSPMFDSVCDFVNGSSLLRSVMVTSKTLVEVSANGGSIERLAGDGKLNHGRNPYFTAADELHGWTTPRQRENWAAITTADGARDDALLWAITTAGFNKATPLGDLFDQAYASPHRVDVEGMGDGGFVVLDRDARLCVHWYAIGPLTAMDDLAGWKRANPASWRTPERIRRDLAKKIDESTKRRLYGNAWTRSRSQWIRDAAWAELVDDELVEATLVEGARVAVAVDASLSHDLTAVSVAAPTGDGRVAVRCRTFSVRQDAPAHVYFAGDTIDLETVERYIAGGRLGHDPSAPWMEVLRDVVGDVVGTDLSEMFDVAIVGFDPRYFARSAQMLEKADLVMARYEPKGAETWSAVQSFYNLAVAGALVVESDGVLAAHVAAAAGEKTDKGWRVSKLAAAHPIDGLISSVIAVDLAIDGLEVEEEPEAWAAVWD